MVVYICVCVGLPMHTVFLEKGNLKKNNNNNKGICAPKSKLANISLFKEFVGDTILIWTDYSVVMVWFPTIFSKKQSNSLGFRG